MPPPDEVIAFEVNDVDKSIVIAGGVTTANLPQPSLFQAPRLVLKLTFRGLYRARKGR